MERLFLLFANPKICRTSCRQPATLASKGESGAASSAPIRRRLTRRDRLAAWSGIVACFATCLLISGGRVDRPRTEFEWNHYFADIQAKGAFESWRTGPGLKWKPGTEWAASGAATDRMRESAAERCAAGLLTRTRSSQVPASESWWVLGNAVLIVLFGSLLLYRALGAAGVPAFSAWNDCARDAWPRCSLLHRSPTLHHAQGLGRDGAPGCTRGLAGVQHGLLELAERRASCSPASALGSRRSDSAHGGYVPCKCQCRAPWR